jgi:PIN domain nuclease of toxin-antitoxin system
MSGYLLDTDTLTLAQFGHSKIVAQLASHSATDITLSAISLQEQMQGWLNRLTRLTDPARLADWYDRLVQRMVPVSGQGCGSVMDFFSLFALPQIWSNS